MEVVIFIQQIHRYTDIRFTMEFSCVKCSKPFDKDAVKLSVRQDIAFIEHRTASCLSDEDKNGLIDRCDTCRRSFCTQLLYRPDIEEFKAMKQACLNGMGFGNVVIDGKLVPFNEFVNRNVKK